jgi:hypothetical protein
LDAISKYKGGREPLRVRIPEHYDDDNAMNNDDDDDEDYRRNSGGGGGGGSKSKGGGRYNDDDDDDDDYNPDDVLDDEDEDMYNRFNSGAKLSVMEDTITDLVDALKEAGYERSDIKPLTMKLTTSGKEISTKDWVLQQADKDAAVESVLLGHVGSLDHIVQCLHYDMVWKPKIDLSAEQDDDDDDKAKDDDEEDKNSNKLLNKY